MVLELVYMKLQKGMTRLLGLRGTWWLELETFALGLHLT